MHECVTMILNLISQTVTAQQIPMYLGVVIIAVIIDWHLCHELMILIGLLTGCPSKTFLMQLVQLKNASIVQGRQPVAIGRHDYFFR